MLFDVFASGVVVNISGNVVNANINISGQSVSTSISGNVVVTAISGTTLNANISGQVTLEYGTIPRTGALVACTASSGGTQLPSGAAFSITIRNISGNAVVYAGSNTTPPEIATPVGMPLYAGDSFTIKTDNLNRIRVAAVNSGNLVAWYSVAQ